jgi:hypothetical protein
MVMYLSDRMHFSFMRMVRLSVNLRPSSQNYGRTTDRCDVEFDSSSDKRVRRLMAAAGGLLVASW